MAGHSISQFIVAGRHLMLSLSGLAALAVPCHGLPLYNFGNPTAEEQQYIELINRARANPPAEGVRLAATTDPNILAACSYFNVDLAMMQGEFNAIAAQPPLAPNASLTTSARGHSAWMLVNITQAHNETNPANDPFTRMAAAGYSFSYAGENIYANAQSVWHGHVGFQVDWGYGTGGMQSPRGHRANIHSPNFREIGVGVTLGTNGVQPNSVGPQLVTQDFATSTANPTFGTGVAYYDLNSNNAYDAGEGIAGLTIYVSGTGVTQNCNTAIGGGWVVPLPNTAGTRTVTFSGLNINQTASLVMPASQNAKADLKLAYAPPAITSSGSAAADVAHTLTFTAVGGASSYHWNRWTLAAAAAENCESSANTTSSTTGTYSVLNTTAQQQGSACFHLENSTGADQALQLGQLYYGLAAPALTFQSEIRYATTAELFTVQVKEEGALEWQDVFSQAGTGGPGEAGYALRSAALGAMTGKAFRARFLLNFNTSGSYYGISGDMFGWFIDSINFTNVATLANNVSQSLSGTSGSFTPGAGSYLMGVAPVISNRDFPASYQTLTATAKTAASVTLGSLAATYTGSPHPATATTTPAGLTVVLTYDGATAAPTNVGSYAVLATISDPSYQGSASGTLVIARAAASVTLGSLAASYTGSPHAATATTTPAGLSVAFTYDGLAAAPTNAGSYAVVGTISDPNYQGSASATLVIASAPVILSQPVSTTISKNASATLAAVAAGTSLTFQWYGGSAGTTTSPISSATGASYTTPTLTKSGSNKYWVRVSNPAGFVNSITSTVTVSNSTVTRSFATWATEIETANNLAAGTIATDLADYDRDGRFNLMEYAMGTSPILGNEAAPRMPVVLTDSTACVMQYQCDTALTDITVTAQACADLGSWKSPGEIPGFTDVPITTVGTIQTRQASVPRSAGSNIFLRLRVTRQ